MCWIESSLLLSLVEKMAYLLFGQDWKKEEGLKDTKKALMLLWLCCLGLYEEHDEILFSFRTTGSVVVPCAMPPLVATCACGVKLLILFFYFNNFLLLNNNKINYQIINLLRRPPPPLYDKWLKIPYKTYHIYHVFKKS